MDVAGDRHTLPGACEEKPGAYSLGRAVHVESSKFQPNWSGAPQHTQKKKQIELRHCTSNQNHHLFLLLLDLIRLHELKEDVDISLKQA